MLVYCVCCLVNLLCILASSVVFNSHYFYFYVKESKISYIVLSANKIDAENLTKKTDGIFPPQTYQISVCSKALFPGSYMFYCLMQLKTYHGHNKMPD